MGANNLVRKCESQAGSLGFSCEEGVKDPFPIFRRNASSFVRHFDLNGAMDLPG